MHTNEQLKELLAMPLEDKIQLSKLRIIEFAEHYKDNVAVSFSGGKDSTVLLHLVRQVYPKVKAVYCDTGLEFPEVKAFVKVQENVDVIRPAMSFTEVVKKYGWVFPSKETAQKIYYAKQGRPWAINHMNGLDSKGKPSKFKERFKKYKYLVDCNIKINSMCCDIMKKKPFHDYLKSTGGVYLLAQ